MERADYLMWMKKRPIFTSNYQASMKSNNESSWEERAFGQDAAGPLGGCLWPPRCYSCGFCRREFRSAQALGGHMNVHRRDRARLRQSPSSHQDEDDDAIRQQQHLEHSKTASIPSLWESRQNFPSELRTLHYDRLDPYSSSGIAVSSSTLSSSRFSALPNRENLSDHTFLSLKVPPSSYNILESDCLAVAFSESAPNSNREQNQREKDSSRVNHDQSVDTELLMGLNSIISQIPPFSSRSGDEGSSCKRPKTTVSAFSFLIKPDTNGRYALQSEVSEPNSSSMGDVDLELRLGEPPKGK